MQNNPFTEIFMVVGAVLLIIGGIVLLYVSKIDTTYATSMFILAASLLGINGALKAPSSGQQANMQQLVSDLTTTMRVNFQHTHAGPSAPPVVAPAPQSVPVIQQSPFTTNTATMANTSLPASQVAQSPVPHPPTSTLPWTGQQQPVPPSSTFPLPVVPK